MTITVLWFPWEREIWLIHSLLLYGITILGGIYCLVSGWGVGDYYDIHRVDRRQRQMCIRDRTITVLWFPWGREIWLIHSLLLYGITILGGIYFYLWTSRSSK